MKMLNFTDDGSPRFTDLINEIVEWRAYLRHSGYLHMQSDRAMSMGGQTLSHSMENLRDELQRKRIFFFEMALTTNLENIRYANIEVTTESIMEKILYNKTDDSMDESDEESNDDVEY